MDAFGWPHLLIILAVIVLLFGAAKLPGVAKALGQSMRVFKSEMAKSKAEDAASAAAVAASVPSPATAVQVAPPADSAASRAPAAPAASAPTPAAREDDRPDAPRT